MKNGSKLADSIAHHIDKISLFFRMNWKTIVVLLWMLFTTQVLLQQQQNLNQMSSQNQVANLRLTVDDIRYSVITLEEQIEEMDHTVSRLDKVMTELELTINRIHAQVLDIPKG